MHLREANSETKLPQGKMSTFRALTILLTLIAFLGILLVAQIFRLISTSHWVDHTDQVIAQTHNVENQVIDMESGMRGFVISGNPAFLDVFERTRPKILGGIEQLRALASNSNEQLMRVDRISSELNSWITWVDKVISSKRSGGNPASEIKSLAGKKRVDAIREQVAGILAEEMRLREERTASATRAARLTLLFAILSFLILGPLIARSFILRRRGEIELEKSEERFRLLVESIEDYAIFMLDPKGNIRSWNRGAERIKGYKAQEVIGKHFSIFYPEEAVKQGHPMHELQIAREKGRYEEEGWRVRKDGTRFWASVIITPVMDHDQSGFAKITRDLTAKKWLKKSSCGKRKVWKYA